MNVGLAIDALRALSALSEGSQEARLLRMDFPRNDGPEQAVMLVNTLTAREEVSRDFHFDVEVLSDDAHIPLKAMMARMVTISLVRNDGSLRYFNGYVAEFRFAGTDGGFARYRMVLEPWLAFTRLRKNCAAFYGRNVQELTEITLQEYLQRDWTMRVYGSDPELRCAHQHNETDYNHLHRRWEVLGLHYWYEHRADGHTLCLSDDSTLADAIDPRDGAATPDAMPFRSEAGASEDDSIHQWQAVRRLGSGQLTLASFDYKNPQPQRVSGYSRNEQGDVAAYELYENAGAYAWQDSETGERLAQQRMEACDQRCQYFAASGNDRAAQAGRSFKLDGHFSAEPRPYEPGQPCRPSIGERDYLILSVLHTASNNYHAGRDAASKYENSFECVRQDQRWRPGRYYNSEPCLFPGVQTALVVGPAADEIHTDGYGRVKIQFHWDRIGQYDAGGTPWTRVMMPMAGANLGQIALPRVGQEVVVQFVDGNMDHPIILGAAYNADHQPPWKLPSQQALTGWRSRELKGGQRSNHLLLDDTSGQIQAQLRSDHLHSQLSLGHIVRVEDTVGRQDARGEGFELRTDGHGVLRAAKGMLLTTEARTASHGGIKDMDETLQRLKAAAKQQRELADQAQAGGALESNSQQGAVADAAKAQNDAIKGTGGAQPELSAPHLVLASPAGIESTSAKSTHIASAEHTALTTGRNLSIAVGDGLFASIRETFRVFVHKAGMKLVAAAGKVTVQARSDEVEIIAQKALSLISEADWVNIRGRKGVRLHGADCMLEISDKVQFFTSSPTLFHGNLETKGPKNQPQPEPTPNAAAPEKGALRIALQTHPGMPGEAGVPYTLYKGGAMVDQSITDEDGCILIAHDDGTQAYRVELPNGSDFELKVHPRLAVDGDAQHREHSLANQGMRALDGTDGGRDHK